MFFIRRFEETLLDLFSQGKLHGTTHTYIGQEANAVGVIDHLEPRARRRLLESPLSRPLPRVHGRRVRPLERGHGKGDGHVRGEGRQPAPVQGELLLERRSRKHRPGRDRDRARGEEEGDGGRLDRVSRRRHARRGRDVRVAQHGRAVEAARPVRHREQPLRAVDARRARAGRIDSGPRGCVRDRGRRARHDGRLGDPRRSGSCGHADQGDERAVLPGPAHLSFQPAFEGRRQPRSGRDREASGA